MLEDAIRFQASEAEFEEIKKALQTGVKTTVKVWPESLAAFEAFLISASQWRIATIWDRAGFPRTIYTGLDYACMKAGLEAAGIKITPKLFEGVRVMEVAAIETLNEG